MSGDCGMCRNAAYVRQRDGAEAARAYYAEQANKAYRKAVLEKKGRLARAAMIRAYKCAKAARTRYYEP